MYSVTQRVKRVKQPYGGYLKPKSFKVIDVNDGEELFAIENIHASLVGLSVDYLTRVLLGTKPEDAFKVSILGASLVREKGKAKKLAKKVKNLDDESIISACKLSGYDVCFRAGVIFYKPVDDINPDENTIHNIRIMVKRCVEFFKTYGPVTVDGFTMEGGYTELVSSGDGDFLTKDTLWDLKVSKRKPTSKHTLQLLMYYLMGKNSIHKEFDTIEKLGIFNPRLGCIYTLNVSEIDSETLKIVSEDVIGYGKSIEELKNMFIYEQMSYIKNDDEAEWKIKYKEHLCKIFYARMTDLE